MQVPENEEPNSQSRAREAKSKPRNGIPVAETKARQDAFLAAYERLGAITAAADEVGIVAKNHYQWMGRDEEYAARFRESDQIAVQALCDEAVRRAQHGVLTPKTVAGEAVNVVEYSDRLLEFLIKGRRPEIYGDRFKQEISGPGGGAIQHQITVRLVDAEPAKEGE